MTKTGNGPTATGTPILARTVVTVVVEVDVMKTGMEGTGRGDIAAGHGSTAADRAMRGILADIAAAADHQGRYHRRLAGLAPPQKSVSGVNEKRSCASWIGIPALFSHIISI